MRLVEQGVVDHQSESTLKSCPGSQVVRGVMYEATLSDQDIDECRVDVLRKLADQVWGYNPV